MLNIFFIGGNWQTKLAIMTNEVYTCNDYAFYGKNMFEDFATDKLRDKLSTDGNVIFVLSISCTNLCH